MYHKSGICADRAPKGGKADMVRNETILLVEDDADDELLTRRTLRKNNIRNDVVVARDGAEALDYLFATGRYEGRDLRAAPQVILTLRRYRRPTGWRSWGASGATS